MLIKINRTKKVGKYVEKTSTDENLKGAYKTELVFHCAVLEEISNDSWPAAKKFDIHLMGKQMSNDY